MVGPFLGYAHLHVAGCGCDLGGHGCDCGAEARGLAVHQHGGCAHPLHDRQQRQALRVDLELKPHDWAHYYSVAPAARVLAQPAQPQQRQQW